METTQLHPDEQIIVRYPDQPPRLPRDLRRRIETAWGGGPVQLYALADLDHALRLTESWVTLGPRHVAFARRAAAGGEWDVQVFHRARVQAGREAPGPSPRTPSVFGAPRDPPPAG